MKFLYPKGGELQLLCKTKWNMLVILGGVN